MNWFGGKESDSEKVHVVRVEPTYPGVLKAALASMSEYHQVTPPSQDSEGRVSPTLAEDANPLSPTARDLLSALIGAEASTLQEPSERRRSSRVRFADEELGAVDFTPETHELLEHLTTALEASRNLDEESKLQLLRLANLLEKHETSCEKEATAANFLSREIRGLVDRGDESTIASRHAEVLSSVLRKELKNQLNFAVGIAPGTGSIKFNFDDPAALVHRALEIIHEHGGPFSDRQRPDSLEQAEDFIAVASAHAFMMSVLDNDDLKAKIAKGDLDAVCRLAALVKRIAPPRDQWQTSILSEIHRDDASPIRRRTMVDDDAFSISQEEEQPPRKRARLASPSGEENRSPLPDKIVHPQSLVSLAPLHDLVALKDVLHLTAPQAHSRAAAAIEYIQAEQKKRMLATSLKRGKQRKRKRHQPNFLAYPAEEGGSPIFVFPDVVPYLDDDDDDQI